MYWLTYARGAVSALALGVLALLATCWVTFRGWTTVEPVQRARSVSPEPTGEELEFRRAIQNLLDEQ